MIGNKLEPFKFWCQKVLPNVYDDSLSYYEYLCKLNEYLNEVIEQINTLTDNMEDYESDLSAQWGEYKTGLNAEWLDYKTQLTQQWAETKNYIDNYFNNLDVQTEINNKLDQMASDGTLDNLIQPYVNSEIATQVTAWLNENVDPVGSAVIVDNTLTVSGAAADSKVTGTNINNIIYPSISGMINNGEFEIETKDITITAPVTYRFNGKYNNGLTLIFNLSKYTGSHLNGIQIVGKLNGVDSVIYSNSNVSVNTDYTIELQNDYEDIGVYIRQSQSEESVISFSLKSNTISTMKTNISTNSSAINTLDARVTTVKSEIENNINCIVIPSISGSLNDGEFELKCKDYLINTATVITYKGDYKNNLSLVFNLSKYTGSHLNGIQIVGKLNGVDTVIFSRSSVVIGTDYNVVLDNNYEDLGVYIRQSEAEASTVSFTIKGNTINAIKNDISEINSAIDLIDANLLNINDVINQTVRWEQGGLNADGTTNDSPNWCRTQFLTGKRIVGAFTGYHININIYDTDDTLLDVVGANNSCSILLNYGNKYKIAIRNADTTPITPSDVIDNTNILMTNGLLYACGDSITYGANNDGKSYIDYVATRLGLTLTKFAQTGATWVLTQREDQSYRPNILTFVNNMISADVEPDFIVLSGGYNDAQQTILNTLGEVEIMGEGKDPHDVYGTANTNPFNTNSVIGAIEHSILALRNKYPHTQFLYVITYNISSEYHWVNEYVPEIIKLLNKWAIPYVDFTKNGNMVRSAGLTDMTVYFTDNIHPNRNGYEIMANYVESAFRNNLGVKTIKE